MTTANVGFWEYGYTGFFWISSMRDLTVYSRYTLKWMKRRILLCSSNMGYIEDNFGNCGTLWQFLTGFLVQNYPPHLPLPGQTKQNSLITVPLESTIKKVVLKGQGLSLDPFLILKTQKRLLEYYRLQKEKELQKRFFSPGLKSIQSKFAFFKRDFSRDRYLRSCKKKIQ